jgi:hypothetical protein
LELAFVKTTITIQKDHINIKFDDQFICEYEKSSDPKATAEAEQDRLKQGRIRVDHASDSDVMGCDGPNNREIRSQRKWMNERSEKESLTSVFDLFIA